MSIGMMSKNPLTKVGWVSDPSGVECCFSREVVVEIYEGGRDVEEDY